MKKILFLICIFISNIINGQTTIKIQNGTFINLVSSSKLIISDPDINPIQKNGTTGGIWTPTQNELVILNISNLTGQFNIPFVSSVGNSIPLSYKITTAGDSSGRIIFNTYETTNDNLPYPAGVSNLSLPSQVIDRFWIIDVSGYTTKPEGIYTFTYDDNDLLVNSISESLLSIQRWNDIISTWDDWIYWPQTNSVTNTITFNISNPQDQFKIWTSQVSQNQPLAIELLSFTVNCDLSRIEWTTASETDNQYFILQATNDGVNFSNLDTVNGSGNSNQIRNYSLSMEDWGYSYFRLHQVDFSGEFKNSNIISGCPQSKVLVKEPILFPNPNNGQFIILHNSTYNFEVFNLIGQRVWSESSNRIDFDLVHLPSGEYFIFLTDALTLVKTFKFVKIN